MSILRYNAGDVVNLYCPNQEDPTKATYRPVIIAEDLGDEMIVVFLTCQTKQTIHYENSFTILKSSPEGILMGLTCDCLVCPSRTAQLRKVLINPPKRGSCPTNIMEKILEYTT